MSSERTTRADVDRIAATVSEGLNGSTVEPQGRNGYTALDLYRDSDGACVDTLHVGTAREVYTYLQGMRRAQLLSSAGA